MAQTSTAVVFVHGLWLHADSWGAWIDRFREAGYVASAPGWPGDAGTTAETRSQPERVAGHGLDDVVGHFARVIGELDSKPVVIGHSFGGLIARHHEVDAQAVSQVTCGNRPEGVPRPRPLTHRRQRLAGRRRHRARVAQGAFPVGRAA